MGAGEEAIVRPDRVARPDKGPPARGRLSQWNGAELRSKGKFYSLIKEWRSASSRSRAHTLWGLGLLYRDLVSQLGRGRGRGRGTAVLLGGGVSAHGPPQPPSWIEVVCAAALYPARRAEASAQPFPTRNSGTQCEV